MNTAPTAAHIRELHVLYCQLTAQRISLRYDRERAWYELLKAGYSAQDVGQVIRYLQKEIRAQRRNVGALKLSNLLQPDRFEEDLHISRVRLSPPPAAPPTSALFPSPKLSEEESARGRQRALQILRAFRNGLRDRT